MNKSVHAEKMKQSEAYPLYQLKVYLEIFKDGRDTSNSFESTLRFMGANVIFTHYSRYLKKSLRVHR